MKALVFKSHVQVGVQEGEFDSIEEMDVPAFMASKDLGTYDVIIANHVLQRMTRAEGIEVMAKCVEHLNPDGQLHVIAPDGLWACEQIIEDGVMSVWTSSILYGPQYDEGSIYLTMYTPRCLRVLFSQVGLPVKRADMGPYAITGLTASGETRTMAARQVSVIGVKDHTYIPRSAFDS